ncbi:MAG: hypothetical protein AAF490_03580 [Chloroflexota bacterium]
MQPLSSLEAQTVEKVARKITQWGLQLPTLFLLEAGQPLSFIGGQMLWVLQPAASLFFPTNQIGHWAELLEKPAALQLLQQKLDTDES